MMYSILIVVGMVSWRVTVDTRLAWHGSGLRARVGNINIDTTP